MIFATVGTQLPFDRLVKSIDQWASANIQHEIIIQSGTSRFKPRFCKNYGYIEPIEWERLFLEADFIIAHAGMGTILKCIDADKPLIILPRQSALGEHRNDHQLATASRFQQLPGIIVLKEPGDLSMAIDRVIKGKCTSSVKNNKNLNKLIYNLKKFSGLEKNNSSEQRND